MVLRLASLLWRLRRATTMESGLFEIQADHLNGLRRLGRVRPGSQKVVYALFGRADSQAVFDRDSHGSACARLHAELARMHLQRGTRLLLGWMRDVCLCPLT